MSLARDIERLKRYRRLAAERSKTLLSLGRQLAESEAKVAALAAEVVRLDQLLHPRAA